MSGISIGGFRGGFCVYWWEDGRRRRYQLAARTRAEAEAEGRDRYLRETAPAGGLTVAALWASHIEHLGTKPTAQTMRHTGKAVLRHFGALRPDRITIRDCRDHAAARAAAGRRVGSVHTELGHLRSALTWAAKCRLIDRAPHIERPPKPASDVRPPSDARIRALMDGCGAPHIRLAVILLLATGARVGAVLDLTWQRVDLERGIIDLRLPDGVTRKGRAGRCQHPADPAQRRRPHARRRSADLGRGAISRAQQHRDHLPHLWPIPARAPRGRGRGSQLRQVH